MQKIIGNILFFLILQNSDLNMFFIIQHLFLKLTKINKVAFFPNKRKITF